MLVFWGAGAEGWSSSGLGPKVGVLGGWDQRLVFWGAGTKGRSSGGLGPKVGLLVGWPSGAGTKGWPSASLLSAND